MIDWEAFGGWLFVYTDERFDGPRSLSHSLRIGFGRFTIWLTIQERDK